MLLVLLGMAAVVLAWVVLDGGPDEPVRGTEAEVAVLDTRTEPAPDANATSAEPDDSASVICDAPDYPEPPFPAPVPESIAEAGSPPVLSTAPAVSESALAPDAYASSVAVFPSDVAGGKTEAPAVTQQAAVAPRKAAARPRAPRKRGPVTLETATTQFETFARSWVDRVGRNFKDRQGHVCVRQEGGEWVASYVAVEDTSLETTVKSKDSRTCPYVGVLRYQEHHFEARGASSDAVRQGPFERVRRVRVTEIFRYDTGRWVN